MFFIPFLALLGILDAGYLTWEHYSGIVPPCGMPGLFSDCGQVLTSPYAVWFGIIPLALIGLFFYIIEFILSLAAFKYKWAKKGLVITTAGGIVFSAYFVFLMVFVIRAICLYCLGSAAISTLLFLVVQIFFWRERKQLIYTAASFLYTTVIKKIFFLLDPEKVHVSMVKTGVIIGKVSPLAHLFSWALRYPDPSLKKTLAGIEFPNPVGLAAGFDYEADLTQTLVHVGFGFQTVGTITNQPYQGNSRPMLGRLPKSKSLMVNKGYKNLGAKATIKKLEGKTFPIPVGISIGVTNSEHMNTLSKVVADIQACFKQFENSAVQHSYYELNISCPNLKVGVSLYPPEHLDTLLTMVDTLKLSRPVFIKMPIEKSDQEYKQMLTVILKHTIAGVIIGNLAKDRNNPALDPSEVHKYEVGNFSGKPTWESSNHLIEYTRKYVKNRLIIIGCGGIFSPEDAQTKLHKGADMVQLITGMIYQGPQLVGQITQSLISVSNHRL